VVGFPIDNLDKRILAQILKGGWDKAREAGGTIVGGHSVKDPEIK
jgi:selenide,water dikinase